MFVVLVFLWFFGRGFIIVPVIHCVRLTWFVSKNADDCVVVFGGPIVVSASTFLFVFSSCLAARPYLYLYIEGSRSAIT
jgi:hypothetical protein